MSRKWGTLVLLLLAAPSLALAQSTGKLAGQIIDVFVEVDPDAETAECHENNNGALYQNVGCGNIPY